MTKTRKNNVIIPTVKVLYKHMQVLINKKMDWKFCDVKPFFFLWIYWQRTLRYLQRIRSASPGMSAPPQLPLSNQGDELGSAPPSSSFSRPWPFVAWLHTLPVVASGGLEKKKKIWTITQLIHINTNKALFISFHIYIPIKENITYFKNLHKLFLWQGAIYSNRCK